MVEKTGKMICIVCAGPPMNGKRESSAEGTHVVKKYNVKYDLV